jgi:hypothetical protein
MNNCYEGRKENLLSESYQSQNNPSIPEWVNTLIELYKSPLKYEMKSADN